MCMRARYSSGIARGAMLRGFSSSPSLFCAAAGGSPIFDELKLSILKKHQSDAPRIKQLIAKHGGDKLSESTVSSMYGGMRGVTGFVYEPSYLDKEVGIRFRGLTISECCEKLPKSWRSGSSPLPEGMLWLLVTGTIPNERQVKEMHEELHRRADERAISAAVKTIASLPDNSHPMTQFGAGLMALQTYSKFATAYSQGKANKTNYWEYALDDSLDLIARSSHVAAIVYNRLATGKAQLTNPSDPNLDWAANFTNMLGFKDESFWDCMRLYLCLHADHEGGNVSAHATVLVASALSDPYLSLVAGLAGLAGPLHGLANQEVLTYLFEMRDKCKAAGVDLHDRKRLAAELEKLTWDVLNAKRVVPGYGHAVLGMTDPRYTCFREYCKNNFPNDELFILVDAIYEIMPGILKKHGKVRNPFPNVDAQSGVLLQHYGMKEQLFYTVLFGLSRQLGVLTGIVWDRLQGRPIERPKTMTSESLLTKYNIA
ncbi:citrate synthase, putative [Trypanosoma brucei gambiense DAL972]|uniref:Citrate synthase n=1 Tax=Trypanosoma brucei gambiense (strain MHOM/CI/86/DAL972) TaxID=679716 RepID=C9ZZW4_TRYB9|nr:citrate synthase, putative [Trypanosoma brucei gambiense DAL972]CBH16522.1 citrate synthase, putative [Trypanosoma brucei gambiense DAL972]|eukprot:XP_011778786.1 citrate synthase, putative [Trypanosoma brucei gambiense DAL972]